MSQGGIASTTGAPVQNSFPITPYVVGPIGVAGYQTIQSGLNAANAAGGGIVYVQPGTYTENLTLFGNTEIVGTPGNSDFATAGNTTIISGVHTPPTTGSFVFANVSLLSATHAFSSNVAGSASLFLINVETILTNGYIFNVPNWTGILSTYNVGDFSTNNGVVNNIGGSTCLFFSATLGNGTAQTMVTTGPISMQLISFRCPWSANTGTTIACDDIVFSNNVTCANNSTGTFNNCRFSTSATASLTMSSSGVIGLYNSVITSTNNPAISGAGAGVLTILNTSFTNGFNIANTLILATNIVRGGNYISQFVAGPAPDAQYQTIQAALDAANAAGGGSVYVKPGTYTENLTLYNKTEVIGATGVADFGSVNISGVHIPPVSGYFVFSGINLISATHIFSSAAAGSATLEINNSSITITNGFIFNLPNWTGSLVSFDVADFSTNNGVVNNTGGATCFFIQASHGAGTGQTMVTSGPVTMQFLDLKCPWSANTGTTIACDYVIFNQTVTENNNSSGHFRYCEFITGATPALTMSSLGSIELSESIVNSTNNPAITGSGSGTLSIANITFLNNNVIANTLTTQYFPTTAQVPGQGLPSIVVASASFTMSTNFSYTQNSAGLITFLLPLTANVGDIIQVVGFGAGGWKITQNAGQSIHINASSTTVGVGGSLASTAAFNSVTFRCVKANTDFTIISSIGTITVV
jgi:hypothetical protein